MIEQLSYLLLDCWVGDYNIEKGEQLSKVLLRLGIEFLEIDTSISDDCITAIDNLAGDMFEPEILSKEIIFCATAYNKTLSNPKLQNFVEQYSDWIRINDEYSWDAEIKSYLRDSIDYAEGEQYDYDIEIKPYKQDILIPMIQKTINSEINGIIDFLQDVVNEKSEPLDENTLSSENIDSDGPSFVCEELSKMILAYETYRPNFASELKKNV